MAPRSPLPTTPTPPVLTSEQKRYRIERFRICIKRLETFDVEKVQRRFAVPDVITLEAGIDKALLAAFGYGTPCYLRYNLAARLDSGPLLTSALQCTMSRSIGGPARDDDAKEARRYFSAGKERSITLLREAIATLEGSSTAAGPVSGPPLAMIATQDEIRPATRKGFDFVAALRRVGRWWRTRP
jgi:hypothetical protein